MLYLDAPIGPIKGLMIYRDHDDRDLFFYIPERPRLAMNDGVPELVFLKYKRDITDNPEFDPEVRQSLGGGFLSFTVDLGVTDDLLDDVKRELSAFADGEVKLAPVQFRKGSVRLSISRDSEDEDAPEPAQPSGFSIFEEVLGTTKPSLFGFNRATFSVVLSQEGATLFEDALRSGISPLGVIYDLEFLGLRPAFNVRVVAEYRRIYDHLEMEFGARGQIYAVSLAADINAAFQKLRDDGIIQVEVTQFTDDEDLRTQANDAFNWVKQELLKDFFEPALEPPSFMNRAPGGGLLGQLQSLFGSLGSAGGSNRTTLAPTMGAPSTATPTPAAPPAGPGSNAQATSETNRTLAGAGGGGTTSPASGGGGGGASEISPFQVAFSLKFFRQEELHRREFEYSLQAAVARDAAPQGLFSTVVEGLDLTRAIREVNLDDDFFKRLVATVSMGGDLAVAGINTVAVNLEYPPDRPPGVEPMHVDGVRFTQTDLDSKTFTTWLNDQKELRYRYKMDVHFRPDSTWIGKDIHVTSDWITSRDRQLTIDPLDNLGLMDVAISLGDMDSGQVSQVQVQLRYEDSPNDFRTEKTFVLTQGAATVNWKLRLSNRDHIQYQYRLTYFMQENVQYTVDWQTTKDPSLVINEPFQGTYKLRLVPLLDSNNLIEAVVDLEYIESETGYTRKFQRVFTPSNLVSQEFIIPTLLPDPVGYQYSVTVVRADGSVFESGKQTAEGSTIAITDGQGITNRVEIRLSNTNLAAAQLVAVRVSLIGPGENPDRDSVLFTPTQNQPQTVALVQPHEEGEFKYHYQVTGYTLQGQKINGEQGETSDRPLIVSLPAEPQ